MIGMALGASPATRPFYNHGMAVLPPVRTALGGVVGAGAGIYTITPVNVPLGHVLLVGTLNNNSLNTDLITVDVDGNALAQDRQDVQGVQMLTLWRWGATAAIVGGTITVDYTGGSGVPTHMVGLAVEVSNIMGVFASSAEAGYAATQNPDSGVTAAPGSGPCFLWGLIGTNGLNADALGAWQAFLTAGQRYSTAVAGCDLKEGYFCSIPANPSQAWISLQTSRLTIATAAVYT